MQLFADDAIFIKTAFGAKAMGQLDGAAMRAGRLRHRKRFPVGATGHLALVALTLLGNWHESKSSL